MAYRIGIDIGKTKIAIGVAEKDGSIKKRKAVKTDMNNGGMNIINQCMQLVKEIGLEDVVGIGIGSSGVIDNENGIILSSGSIPNWSNINIKNIFEKEFNVPLFIDNDVNAAALGEYCFGAGKQYSSIVLLTISTGIGFSTVIDGKLLRGNSRLAGQIAHLPLFTLDGTVNSFLSGRGIENRCQKMLKIKLSTQDVFKRSKEGNKICKSIINDAEDAASDIIAWIANSIDPEALILSGSIALNQIDFVQNITSKVNRKLNKYSKHRKNGIIIKNAKLGSDVGILGGIAIFDSNFSS